MLRGKWELFRVYFLAFTGFEASSGFVCRGNLVFRTWGNKGSGGFRRYRVVLADGTREGFGFRGVA